MELLNAAIDDVASAVGVATPVFKILVSLLLGYPLAFVFDNVPRSQVAARHVLSGLFGAFIVYFNFGTEGLVHTLGPAVGTFVLLDVVGVRLKQWTAAVVLNFAWSLGYLLVGYAAVATDGYHIDWTLPYCVLCLRLIGLGFDYWDEAAAIESAAAAASAPTATTTTSKAGASGAAANAARTAVATASPVELFGYALCFPSVMVGPQFSLRRYRLMITKRPPTYRGRFAYAASRLLLGAVYLGANAVLSQYYNGGMINSEYYRGLGIGRATWMLWAVGKIAMSKYLGTWLVMEGAAALAGLGYRWDVDAKARAAAGADDKQKAQAAIDAATWDGAANVLPLQYEFASDLKGVIGAFNINTNEWCKQYIFKRCRFLGSKHASSIITLMFLAQWHGFKFGFYLTFFLEFLLVDVEARLRKRAAPLRDMLYKSAGTAFLYDYGVCLPLRQFVTHFGYLPFETMYFAPTMAMFNHVLWWPMAVAGVFLLLDLTVLPRPPRPPPATAADDDKKRK